LPGWVEVELPDDPLPSLGNKPRHPGGRRRLHWEAIRRAYDTIPKTTLARLDTDAKLYRCLDRKLAKERIAVSHATMARALAGHRILCKT
jgi:hypothetical protein